MSKKIPCGGFYLGDGLSIGDDGVTLNAGGGSKSKVIWVYKGPNIVYGVSSFKELVQLCKRNPETIFVYGRPGDETIMSVCVLSGYDSIDSVECPVFVYFEYYSVSDTIVSKAITVEENWTFQK